MDTRELPDSNTIQLSDFTDRLTCKPILATTAMYAPWRPDGTFDDAGYRHLVRDVMRNDSVPATNVDTTWAQYNSWPEALRIIRATAEAAVDFSHAFPSDRPLLVVGLNTNREELALADIAPSIRRKIVQVRSALRDTGVDRVRFMPIPDRRLIGASTAEKVTVYRDIGVAVADNTDTGMVLFELDIGIPAFGSDFSVRDIREILAATPAIQEYKSALIAAKPNRSAYPYDIRDDIARIMVVEQTAPRRVQFSTGNDWCIGLARLGANLPRFGYLLGASQMSPRLFKVWRDMVANDDLGAVPLEQDLQAAARDFWTPGNVGIYRHYLAILLTFSGQIAHPLPHPRCDKRFVVPPEGYWLPLKHAIRLGLLSRDAAPDMARQVIPGVASMGSPELDRRIRLLG